MTISIDKRIVGGNFQILPRRTTKLKLATFGDSTGNFGDSQSPANNDTSVATAPMPVSGSTGITRNIDKIFLQCSYPILEPVTNACTSGRTVATMVTDEQAVSTVSTRKVIDAENNSPDIILFRGDSINDFVQASYPITDNAYNLIVSNHKVVLHRLMNTNAFIISEGIYGYSKGLAGYPADANGDAVRAAIIRFNNEISAYVAGLNKPDRIIYLNPIGINCDSTGAYLAGHSTLADGIHNSIVGGYYRALAEQAIIEARFGVSSLYKHQGINVQINPLFSLTTAPGYGTVPTNYSWVNPVNSTRQNAKVEVIDGYDWATVELLTTATLATGVQLTLPYNPLVSGTNPLNVAANDKYGFELDFSIKNVTSGLVTHISSLYMRLRTYDVTNAKSVYLDTTCAFTSDAQASIPGRLKMHLATPPYKFQEAAAALGTSSQWIVVFLCDATAGDIIKVGMSNPRIVKLN